MTHNNINEDTLGAKNENSESPSSTAPPLSDHAQEIVEYATGRTNELVDSNGYNYMEMRHFDEITKLRTETVIRLEKEIEKIDQKIQKAESEDKDTKYLRQGKSYLREKLISAQVMVNQSGKEALEALRLTVQSLEEELRFATSDEEKTMLEQELHTARHRLRAANVFCHQRANPQ